MLNCGQCFRWSKNDNGEWVGVIGKRIWILKQDADQLFYKSMGNHCNNPRLTSVEGGKPYNSLTKSRKGRATTLPVFEPVVEELKIEDEESILRDYFQLKVDLESLYDRWSKNDQVFNRLSQNFGGLRMLRQDPVENLFSFICSQNNHISRIESMVERLCTNYGQLINKVAGKSYYEFPTITALSNDEVDGNLRKLGFGYRAKFISQCAKQLLQSGESEWLYKLRNTTYKEAHNGMSLFE